MKETVRTLVIYCGVSLLYLVVMLTHGTIFCSYTPDSLWYADVARFLARGDGLQCNIGQASNYTQLPAAFYGWPPLYPGLGALLVRAGISPLTAMRAVSMAAFLLLPLPLLRLGSRLWGRYAAVAATIIIPFVPTIFGLSSTALSEPLFLLLLAIGTDQVIADGRTTRRAVTGGVIFGLASLTRLAGGIFIGGLGLLLLIPGRDGRRRWRAPLIGVGSAVVIAAPWVIRNSWHTGGPSGWEEPAVAIGFLPVLASSIQRWFWEWGSIGSVGTLLSGNWKVVLLLLGAATVMLHILKQPVSRILAIWGIGYMALVAWMRTQGPFDSPGGGRIMAPSLFLLTFVMAGGLIRSWSEPGSVLRKYSAVALYGLLFCCLVGGRIRDMKNFISPGGRSAEACSIAECGTPGLIMLQKLAEADEPVLSTVAFKTGYCQNRPSIQLPIFPYSAMKLTRAELFALSNFHNAHYLYIEIPGRRFEGNYPSLIVALAHGERIPGIEPLMLDPAGSLFEITTGKPSAISHQLSAGE